MTGGMDVFSSFGPPKGSDESGHDSHEADASGVDVMDLFGNPPSAGAGQPSVDEPARDDGHRAGASGVDVMDLFGDPPAAGAGQPSVDEPASHRADASRDRKRQAGGRSTSTEDDIRSAAQMFLDTEGQKARSAGADIGRKGDGHRPTGADSHTRVKEDGGRDRPDAGKDEGLDDLWASVEDLAGASGVNPSAPKPGSHRDEKVDRLGSHTGEKVDRFRHKDPPAYKIAVDVAKYGLLEKRFTKGRSVLALDGQQKPLMQLYQSGNELMAYKYLGTSLEVRIPAYVGDLPVRYVHGKMFTGTWDVIDRNGMRNLRENLGGKDVINMDMAAVKRSFGGIKSVIFPETLVALPARLFAHCYSVTEIVIPASVVNISKGSCTHRG